MKIQSPEFWMANYSRNSIAPNSMDIDQFSTKLKQGSSGGLPNATAAETAIAREVLSAGRNRQRFDETIQEVVNTRDPVDLLKVSRSMSEYYTHTMMTTKIIAKGVQSVEKLTSLQ